MTGVLGLDYSHYNSDPPIDWTKVNRSWAIGKVTERITADPTWSRNRQQALSHGKKLSGYHWAHIDHSPSESARIFKQVLQQTSTMFVPWIDIEHNGNPDIKQPLGPGGFSPTYIYNWLLQFADAYGDPIGIYTGNWFWKEAVAPAVPAVSPINNWPLWLSEYPQTINLQEPNYGVIPRGFKQVDLWQYSDKGSIPGIVGNIDLDITVASTIDQLVQYAQRTDGGNDVTPAQMQQIMNHIDHAVDQIRTETSEGNSIANVMKHLKDLQDDVTDIKAKVDGGN